MFSKGKLYIRPQLSATPKLEWQKETCVPVLPENVRHYNVGC